MRFALLFLAIFGAAAVAQPRYDDAAFREEAAVQYRKILASVAAKGQLDDDPVFLARTRRIAAGLVVAASQVRPDSAAWSWEIHVTSDRSKGASCMAGGKILVASELVRRMALTDGELAMLLAHEIAHAVADHRRAASRLTMDSDATEEAREAAAALAQEDEADRIGIELAHRAGWPAASLLSFFDKLAAQESAGTFSASHSPAAARAAAARILAEKLARSASK